MPKSKLTLYIDEDTNRWAHRTAEISGRSISAMVKEYFIEKAKQIRSKPISPSVLRWVGVLKTPKSYKELRDEAVKSHLRKYESSD